MTLCTDRLLLILISLLEILEQVIHHRVHWHCGSVHASRSCRRCCGSSCCRAIVLGRACRFLEMKDGRWAANFASSQLLLLLVGKCGSVRVAVDLLMQMVAVHGRTERILTVRSVHACRELRLHRARLLGTGLYRAKVVTSPRSGSIVVDEVAFTEGLLEVLAGFGLEAGLDLLLSNENVCGLLLGLLLCSGHSTSNPRSSHRVVLLACARILIVTT